MATLARRPSNKISPTLAPDISCITLNLKTILSPMFKNIKKKTENTGKELKTLTWNL